MELIEVKLTKENKSSGIIYRKENSFIDVRLEKGSSMIKYTKRGNSSKTIPLKESKIEDINKYISVEFLYNLDDCILQYQLYP